MEFSGFVGFFICFLLFAGLAHNCYYYVLKIRNGDYCCDDRFDSIDCYKLYWSVYKKQHKCSSCGEEVSGDLPFRSGKLWYYCSSCLKEYDNYEDIMFRIEND